MRGEGSVGKCAPVYIESVLSRGLDLNSRNPDLSFALVLIGGTMSLQWR